MIFYIQKRNGVEYVRKLYCNINTLEKRIAVVENNKLVDVMIQREDEEDYCQYIYMGRV